MDAEEVRNERAEYVKNRLRATMKRIKKRQVQYSTTGTNDTTGTPGTEDQLEEEAAFKEQCNRSDDEDTPPM